LADWGRGAEAVFFIGNEQAEDSRGLEFDA
jgi:hypothetical protein